MSKILIANWKMNPATFAEARELVDQVLEGFSQTHAVRVVFCPPHTYIQGLNIPEDERLARGAQDVFWEASGAFTGAVSVSMLKDAGAAYAIIGHSERRRLMGEDDVAVAKKVAAAYAAGLTPVVCIGEWDREGKSMDEVREFVRNQLVAAFSLVDTYSAPLYVAYEPVWAISSMGGGPDDPRQAAEMVRYIRSIAEGELGVPKDLLHMLYGGSMNDANVQSFLSEESIEGGLIGSASLKSESFNAMLRIADEL